jgi:dephospho-CoA kinase
MRLGLTGGIGCGKSTFGKLLAERGWRLVQSDLVAREILEAPEMSARVAELFGPGVIGADGKPDREALGKIVFADKAALAALEAELHPRVRAHWKSLTASDPKARWVVEIPLLFEKSLDADFDLTVCVHCSHSTQLARLESRGLPPEPALARMKAQLPVEEKVRRATLAVFNEGSPDFLAQQADLLSRITKPFPTP